MSKRRTEEDDELLAELGLEAASEKVASFTTREERIIAGFEDIKRFYEEHDRLPEKGEDKDIFERMFAVRLEQISASGECLKLLSQFDAEGLLDKFEADAVHSEECEATDEELLEALGVVSEPSGNITNLEHVRSFKDKAAAEQIADHKVCEDFEQYKPIFEKVQSELESGERLTASYHQSTKFEADIQQDELFIIGGQKVLIAEIDDQFVTGYERKDRRLRVIYDNGTESDLLLRSLQRSLYRDKHSRRILPPQDESTPLFAQDNDTQGQTGYIYVVRSLSDEPLISEFREVFHKIGVTSGDIDKRIANAKKDPTFLLADVDLVASFELLNINPGKMEKLLHKFFSPAKLNMKLPDRFGQAVKPREWFLVPLETIQAAVELIKDQQITHCRYDPTSAKIIDNRTDKPI